MMAQSHPMPQSVNRTPQRLRSPQAEGGGGGGVPGGDQAVLVHGDQDGGDRGQHLLALGQDAFQLDLRPFPLDDLVLERFLRPLALGDIAEVPDPPIGKAFLGGDRGRVAVERAAVPQRHLVTADLLGVRVQELDFLQELLRPLHERKDVVHHGAVVAPPDGCQHVLIDVPQPAELLVEADDAALLVDDEDAVQRGLLLRLGDGEAALEHLRACPRQVGARRVRVLSCG